MWNFLPYSINITLIKLKKRGESFMAKVKIVFHGCLQDSQEIGSDDEHMVSRVFFSLEVGKRNFDNLFVNIKQPVGSNYEDFPFEVESPKGIDGPFNYEAFRNAVETYYRELVGSQGSMIKIVNSNVRMMNNRIEKRRIFNFDIV
jgi:hypothetical protein